MYHQGVTIGSNLAFSWWRSTFCFAKFLPINIDWMSQRPCWPTLYLHLLQFRSTRSSPLLTTVSRFRFWVCEVFLQIHDSATVTKQHKNSFVLRFIIAEHSFEMVTQSSGHVQLQPSHAPLFFGPPIFQNCSMDFIEVFWFIRQL